MPDITTIIENDHREVERLFESYRSSGPSADRQAIVDRIRVMLAQHSAAEEILVYPTVRRTAEDGDALADHSIDEHQEIKRLLAELDDLSADDPAQSAKVADLERAVAEHVEEEESVVLPALIGRTDSERRERLGELFEDTKPLLPTRPHPSVPGTASAQLLVGPLASVADRIRDFVGR
jgi:hemerythrin superfamily protein